MDRADNDNLADRDHLITEHVTLALQMARRMMGRMPERGIRDDIEGAALLGLTEAACRYDRGREEPFMAFAAKRVRGAILDYLRHDDVLTRKGRQDARRVAEVRRGIEGKLGRAATDSEIAEAMGVSDHEFGARYSTLREAGTLCLDQLRGRLPNPNRNEIHDRQQLRTSLRQAVARLEKRQVEVLASYYREGLTLREIGEKMGVTESRACQIHAQALRHLREELLAAA